MLGEQSEWVAFYYNAKIETSGINWEKTSCHNKFSLLPTESHRISEFGNVGVKFKTVCSGSACCLVIVCSFE